MKRFAGGMVSAYGQEPQLPGERMSPRLRALAYPQFFTILSTAEFSDGERIGEIGDGETPTRQGGLAVADLRGGRRCRQGGQIRVGDGVPADLVAICGDGAQIGLRQIAAGESIQLVVMKNVPTSPCAFNTCSAAN